MITGPIVLRMSFDDATDLLSFSFSLDGGLTFQSPFTPLQAFRRDAEAEVLLGAAALPQTAPPLGCVPIQTSKIIFQKLNQPQGAQGIRASGKMFLHFNQPPSFNPLAQGARLVALSGTGLGAVYDVPAGAVGSVPCGPRDGWKHRGETYTYVNVSGMLPPSCAVSANGLRKLKFKDERTRNGRLGFALSAKNATISGAPSDQAILGVYVGAPAGQASYSACGEQLVGCVSRGKTVRCQ